MVPKNGGHTCDVSRIFKIGSHKRDVRVALNHDGAESNSDEEKALPQRREIGHFRPESEIP